MTKTTDKKEIKKLTKELDLTKAKVKLVEGIRLETLQNFDAFTIKPNKSLKEQATVITQLGDAHIDEIVNKNIINGLNEYNPDIAAKRIERYFQRLIYLTNQQRRGGTKITNLVLQLVGDFISGWIHEELKETNSMSPIMAIMTAQELLIKGIKTLAQDGGFDKIVIIGTCGNHGRTTDKQRNKNAVTTSYEYFMYNNMMQMFKTASEFNNVEFLLSESEYIYYKVYDLVNMFSHGNHFNYAGGIGGIEVPTKRWLMRSENIVKFDMAWIGHWHQLLSGRRIRINGSVIGYSEYARNYGFFPEPPQMQFQIVDAKRGYTWNTPILLNDF